MAGFSARSRIGLVPGRVGQRYRLARCYGRGEGERHLAAAHRNRGDAPCLAIYRYREIAGGRLGTAVERLAVQQRQLVSLYFRFGERRGNAIDLVAGLIGLRAVREVRVYRGVVLADAPAVELEAVGVDGRSVDVLVVSLHRVLKQEPGRGRAALVVGLAHGGADGQVDPRRAGDCYRLIEGHGDVHYVIQFVGIVLPGGRRRGERDTRYRRRGERCPVDRIGPRALPFVVLRLYLDLVGPARAQAGDRAGPGRAGVGPIGKCATDAVLHMVVRDVRARCWPARSRSRSDCFPSRPTRWVDRACPGVRAHPPR